MGLDFSHTDAHWGYMGFMLFRTKLAAEAGIALHCMSSFTWSFGKNKPYKDVWVCGYEEGNSLQKPPIGIQPVIKWANVHDDIVPLLNHSDCDGELSPEECLKIAPRLRELVSAWDDDDRDKENALWLAEGMELAASRNEPLEFR
jgi:hypothetical protein